MADEEQTTADVPTPPPANSGSFLGRLMLVGFMGTVVIAECLFAYFWLPSADEVMARTEEMAEKLVPEEEKSNEETEEIQAKEVALGEFTVTNHQSVGEATLRTEFRLFGTVAAPDEAEFNDLFARNTNRFRDCVIMEIRNSKVVDLTDAKLGLIKRRILEKSNALFGKPILRSVGFADYAFVEL
jgi:hypothetical protein